MPKHAADVFMHSSDLLVHHLTKFAELCKILLSYFFIGSEPTNLGHTINFCEVIYRFLKFNNRYICIIDYML